MTQREFYTAVINASVSEDITEFAKGRIAHLDEVNSKRTSKGTPTQRENAEIKARIIAEIDKGVPFTAVEIAEKFDISPNKASALCGQIAKAGGATVGETKNEKKNKVKAYTFTEV